MKRLILLFAALSLTACGANSPIRTATDAIAIATSSTPIGDRIKMDEKAAYAAEALYNVPAFAYVSADQRGLVSPELRSVLRPKLITMATWLKLVRQAYAVGDATSFSQRYRELEALKAAITPLIPR